MRSSAYWWYWTECDWITASISDTYIANNNSPNTLPCGTPDDKAHVSDFTEPTAATYCDRSETNDLSQLSAVPVTPKSDSMRLHSNYYYYITHRLSVCRLILSYPSSSIKQHPFSDRPTLVFPGILLSIAVSKSPFLLRMFPNHFLFLFEIM